MSVLSLYIFRQLTLIFLILVGVLTGLVWVSQAIRFLNLVIEKGRSLGEFLQLTGYLVPAIMGLVAPTALLIATVFVLHRLNSDSELAVVQAAGGSQWRLLRPFFAVGFIVTGFVIFVNLYAMPHGMRAFREKLISVRTDLISTLVQEGQFVSPENGLTVHIRATDTNGDLLGLLFHDTRKDDGRITYLAERARIVSEDEGTSLIMFNGTFQRRRETPKDVDVVRFKEYTLDLDSFGPDRKVPYYQASEKSMSELLNPDPDDPIFIDHPGKIIAEIHERLSSPLYVLTMMLIAFAGLSEAKSNRIGRVWLIMGVLALATGVRLLGATSLSLVVKTNNLFPLPYGIPLVAMLSVLTYLAIHNRAGREYHNMVRNRPVTRSSPRAGPSTPANLQQRFRAHQPIARHQAAATPIAKKTASNAELPWQDPETPTRPTSSFPNSPDSPRPLANQSPTPARVAGGRASQGPEDRIARQETRQQRTPARRPDPHQALRRLANPAPAPQVTTPGRPAPGPTDIGNRPPPDGIRPAQTSPQGKNPLRTPSMLARAPDKRPRPAPKPNLAKRPK